MQALYAFYLGTGPWFLARFLSDPAWALGIIPFLIGATYLLFWRLEGKKFTFNTTANDNAGTDTPPPLP